MTIKNDIYKEVVNFIVSILMEHCENDFMKIWKIIKYFFY